MKESSKSNSFNNWNPLQTVQSGSFLGHNPARYAAYNSIMNYYVKAVKNIHS